MTLTGAGYIAIEWTFIVLTGSLVIIRLILRSRLLNTLRLSDAFVIFAFLVFLTQTCMDSVSDSIGLFDKTFDASKSDFSVMSYDDMVLALKIIWIETSLYYTMMYSIKFAMLTFYIELIPRGRKNLRLMVYLTMVFTLTGWLVSLFAKLFNCEPVRSNWTPGPAWCNSLDNVASNVTEWVLHVLTDLIIYIIPIFMLRGLQMPKKQKLGVALTFAVGFLCIVWANLFQISILLNNSFVIISLYSVLEQGWAMFVVCCPTFKSLFNGKGFIKSLFGKPRSSESNSNVSSRLPGISWHGESRRVRSDSREELGVIVVDFEMKSQSVVDEMSTPKVTTAAWSAC